MPLYDQSLVEMHEHLELTRPLPPPYKAHHSYRLVFDLQGQVDPPNNMREQQNDYKQTHDIWAGHERS
jgi:hypothetical protein